LEQHIPEFPKIFQTPKIKKSDFRKNKLEEIGVIKTLNLITTIKNIFGPSKSELGFHNVPLFTIEIIDIMAVFRLHLILNK
jgi:hypothetical protein